MIAGLVYVNFAFLDNPFGLPAKYGEKMMVKNEDAMMEDSMASPEPISDDTDTATIEAELNATEVGDLEGEFDDANSSLNEL